MRKQYGYNPGKNFQRNDKVQIFRDNEWVDYTKPCGSKVVVELAVRAMTIYGPENVRITSVQKQEVK